MVTCHSDITEIKELSNEHHADDESVVTNNAQSESSNVYANLETARKSVQLRSKSIDKEPVCVDCLALKFKFGMIIDEASHAKQVAVTINCVQVIATLQKLTYAIRRRRKADLV